VASYNDLNLINIPQVQVGQAQVPYATCTHGTSISSYPIATTCTHGTG